MKILKLDSNKTQEEVYDIFKCSVRSLMRWVENDDNIKRHNREAISYTIFIKEKFFYKI